MLRGTSFPRILTEGVKKIIKTVILYNPTIIISPRAKSFRFVFGNSGSNDETELNLPFVFLSLFA